MPQKKFATIYGIVIGVAVIALVIAFYHGAPQSMNAPTTPSVPAATPAPMIISSPAFMNNGDIPAKFTCDDKGVNPELDISGVPANAKSLALILHDPDAPMPGGFTHWVMWNIPASITFIAENSIGIGEDSLPLGTIEGENGSGKTGYIGLCPPSGTHHYHFMLFALDSTLNIATSSKKADLESAMKGHIVTQTELIGLYAKTKK